MGCFSSSRGALHAVHAVLALGRVGQELVPGLVQRDGLGLTGPDRLPALDLHDRGPVGRHRLRVTDGTGRLLPDEFGFLLGRGGHGGVAALDLVAHAVGEATAAFAREVLRMTGFELCQSRISWFQVFNVLPSVA